MILCRILFMIVLLFSNITPIDMNNNIFEIISTSKEINVYNDNKQQNYKSDCEEYKKISQEILNLSLSARETPALGVSLHDETLEEMKKGIWIEFIFDNTITHNELPFDSLLINIVGEYTGFNIIRKYKNKYEGRCFYVDIINNDLSTLESILTNAMQ